MWGDAFCSKGAAFKWSFCLTRRCLLQVKELFKWSFCLTRHLGKGFPSFHAWLVTNSLLSMARALSVTVTPWAGQKTLPSPHSAPAQALCRSRALLLALAEGRTENLSLWWFNVSFFQQGSLVPPGLVGWSHRGSCCSVSPCSLATCHEPPPASPELQIK